MTLFSTLNAFGLITMTANIAAFIFLIIQYRRLKSQSEKKPLMLFIIAFIVAIVISIYIRQIAPAISDTIFNKRQFQKIKEISKLNLNNKI
jgi:tellurite resistance protein TehA-like permease